MNFLRIRSARKSKERNVEMSVFALRVHLEIARSQDRGNWDRLTCSLNLATERGKSESDWRQKVRQEVFLNRLVYGRDDDRGAGDLDLR